MNSKSMNLTVPILVNIPGCLGAKTFVRKSLLRKLQKSKLAKISTKEWPFDCCTWHLENGFFCLKCPFCVYLRQFQYAYSNVCDRLQSGHNTSYVYHDHNTSGQWGSHDNWMLRGDFSGRKKRETVSFALALSETVRLKRPDFGPTKNR